MRRYTAGSPAMGGPATFPGRLPALGHFRSSAPFALRPICPPGNNMTQGTSPVLRYILHYVLSRRSVNRQDKIETSPLCPGNNMTQGTSPVLRHVPRFVLSRRSVNRQDKIETSPLCPGFSCFPHRSSAVCIQGYRPAGNPGRRI